MLELYNLQVAYGGIQALHDVSLHVEEGEIVSLIGSNGAGKSTTLRAISGISPALSGKILFGKREIQAMQPDKIVALGISQVPEGRRIFPHLSVMENLALGAFLRKDRKGIREDMEYVFALFPILSERKKQSGGTLSGGEQQMLAISRALMARPRLLLLDEPSLGLAPLMIRQIFDIIQKINRSHGTTILLVEQNASMALQIAGRGYVMENGRIVLNDKADNLQKNDRVRKAYLGL